MKLFVTALVSKFLKRIHLRRQSATVYSLKNFVELDYSLTNSKLKLNIIEKFLASNRTYTAVVGSLICGIIIQSRIYC